MNERFTPYYRVSTKKQNYGIEVQKQIVQRFVESKNGVLIGSFEEKSSAKNNNRTELQNAIDLCKEQNTTLLIAKLDRLSRNVSFLFQLRDSGIKIACCDLHELNTLTLGIFATMAQHEREIISKRTKDGLKVAKQNGKQIGRKKGCDNKKAIKASIESRRIRKLERNFRQISLAKTLRRTGMTYSKIANEMNNAGFKSSFGGRIFPTSVERWIKS